MMRHISLAFIAAAVVACTVQSDKLDNREATRAYLAPTFCAKAQDCNAPLFAIEHQTDASRAASDDGERQRLERVECERKLNEKARAEELTLTPCTNEEFQLCRADMRAASCPQSVEEI